MTTTLERPKSDAPNKKNEERLARMRVRMWPRVLIAVLLVIALFVALWQFFSLQVAVVAAVVCLILGLGWLVIGGGMHAMSKEEEEAARASLPGHDVFKPEDVRVTGGKSYDFDCSPSDLYPYLVQMNLTKSGFYSFQFFERLFSFHIRNDYTIRPEWQRIEIGDWMYYHQNGAGTGIVDFKQNEYIVTYSDTRSEASDPLAICWRPKWMKGFAWTWNFVLQPRDGGRKTHFISYLQAWWPEDTSKLTQLRLMLQWGLPSNFMMNKMASVMGRLAERDAQAWRSGKPRPGYNWTK